MHLEWVKFMEHKLDHHEAVKWEKWNEWSQMVFLPSKLYALDFNYAQILMQKMPW